MSDLLFNNKPTKFHGGEQNPDTIVIHAMGEYINGVHASDFLSSIKLSAHYLIELDGVITKLVPTDRKAYHAKGHNTNTIGIEVLVEGDHNYETFIEAIKSDYVKPKQMEVLINLVNAIDGYWPIQRVVRHSDIDPERKEDPGTGFDWEYFKSKIYV